MLYHELNLCNLKKRRGKERTEKEGIVFFLIHLTCNIYMCLNIKVIQIVRNNSNDNKIKE